MRSLQQSGETWALPSYLWTFSPPSLRGPARPVAKDVRHFVTLLCPYSIPSSSLPLFIVSYPIPPSFSSLCLIPPSFLHSLLAPYLLFPLSFLLSHPSVYPIPPSIFTAAFTHPFLLSLPPSIYSLSYLLPFSTLSLPLSLSLPLPSPYHS